MAVVPQTSSVLESFHPPVVDSRKYTASEFSSVAAAHIVGGTIAQLNLPTVMPSGSALEIDISVHSARSSDADELWGAWLEEPALAGELAALSGASAPDDCEKHPLSRPIATHPTMALVFSRVLRFKMISKVHHGATIVLGRTCTSGILRL